MMPAALYVGDVDDTVDPDIEELLDGLEGNARAERAELIEWLFEQGITADEIRGAVAPTLLATRRLMGDDGSCVSAREISPSAGIELDLLQLLDLGLGQTIAPEAVQDAAEVLAAVEEDLADEVVEPR